MQPFRFDFGTAVFIVSVSLPSVLHVFTAAVGMLNDGVIKLLTECGAEVCEIGLAKFGTLGSLFWSELALLCDACKFVDAVDIDFFHVFIPFGM